jgi:hypothetical protein
MIRKYPKEEGKMTLGISAIKVAFNALLTASLILDSSTTSSRSFPTNS